MKKNINRKVLGLLALGCISTASAIEPAVNVRVAPSALYGVLNARVDFQIDKHLSVGPTFDYAAWLFDYYSVGVGANWKLNGEDVMRTSGWYLNPYAAYGHGRFKVQDDDKKIPSISNVGVGLILGHQWVADSGFNFRIGFGGQYNSGKVFGKVFFPDMSMTFGCVF